MLHIRIQNIGYWLVGLAGMAMMVLCVSGVIIHRKIFTDFFTFRPDRKPRRLILDLHNVTGVLGLPFHFLISLSGLVIFWATYFPSSWQVTYNGDRLAFFADAYGNVIPKSDRASPAAWPRSMPWPPRRGACGTARRCATSSSAIPAMRSRSMQIGRLDEGIVSSTYDAAYFDGPTGALISYRTGTAPVMSTQRFLSGFHFIQFRHWSLRWIYFGLGLAGCVLIATGYLFWLESRRKKHAQLGLRGVRIVEGLAIGSVTGMLIATVAFFVVNRLLPLGASALGQDRAALEVWTFYLVWLASFAPCLGTAAARLDGTVLDIGRDGVRRGAAQLDHDRRSSAARPVASPSLADRRHGHPAAGRRRHRHHRSAAPQPAVADRTGAPCLRRCCCLPSSSPPISALPRWP